MRAWSVATHLKFLQIVGISELPFWKKVYWIYPRYPFFVIRGSGKSGVLECVGRMYPLCSFMLSSTWKSCHIYVNQSFQNIMHKATSQNSYQININILDWFKTILNKKKCFLWLHAGMNNANFVEKKYVLSASFVVWILYSAINWAFHCLYIQIRNSFCHSMYVKLIKFVVLKKPSETE